MIDDLRRIETRFEARALASPEALAMSSEQGRMTYGELLGLARRYALQIGGEDRRAVVGILAERGPQVVIAALACAFAGRPFAILDLAYPRARLEALMDLCRPSLLLLAGRKAATAAMAFDLPRLQILADARGDLAVDGSAPAPARSPDDPAYLLFTSGSTGAPKGVACSHRPLVNFISWQERTFGLGAGDRFTMLSGLSHDPVLRDVFTPLSLGASIHIPDQETLTAPGGLAGWFVAVQPTVAHMTPQLGHLLTAGAKGRRVEALRYVFWGGDMLRGAQVEALSALAAGCESVNFYGSTETPQAAAYHRVRPGAGDERAPIGVGINGFELDIVNDDGWSVDDGEAGDIVVRSRFLTLGYVADGLLPAAKTTGEIGAYATGDVGVRRADGQVMIRGRRDDQVKVRGYRVELAEISAAALKVPGAAQAATLNVGDRESVRIAAFVTPSEGAALDADFLRSRITADLPAYMVPDEIVLLERLPLLANGKVDRQALIQSVREAPPGPAVGGLAPAEAELLGLWRGIFRSAALGPDSSFASLAGDSLSYVNAYLAVEQVLGEVPSGWTTMTVRQLAALKSGKARSLFVEVESAMVLRALAITTVVASHFQLIYSGGAATSTLFWISGFLFGGLQLHEVDQQKTLEPIARLLRSVALPLFAIVVPLMLLKAAVGAPQQLSSLFLNVDLIDFTGATTEGSGAFGGHDYLLWFVHCTIHMIFIVAGVLMVFHRKLKLPNGVLISLIATVIAGLATRFILPLVLMPGFGQQRMDGMSFFGHSPTAHLATFALAALSGFLRGRWRWTMLAVTAAYAILSVRTYGLMDSVAILGAAGLLAIAPKIRVPRLMSRPIYLVAGASLFIYLLHFRFLAVVNGALHAPTLVAFPIAVAGGVVAWSLWNWGAKYVADALERGGRWISVQLRAAIS